VLTTNILKMRELCAFYAEECDLIEFGRIYF
jgi:hypothetical protein